MMHIFPALRRSVVTIYAAMIFMLLIFSGCNGGAQDSEARIATRVAEDQAVSATLTATAQEAAAGQDDQAEASAAEGDTEEDLEEDPEEDTEEGDAVAQVAQAAVEPDPTATPTEVPAVDPPTATPSNTPTSTPTLEPATATPSPTPTVAQAPTPTPIVAGVIPTDGSEGEGREILISEHGRAILLPGFPQSAITSPMVFSERLTARIKVFDTRLDEEEDGNGIAGVRFAVTGPNGESYVKEEYSAAFCLFGGDEPDCPGVRLGPYGQDWPDGTYDTTITIVAESDGLRSDWFWQFCVNACDGGDDAAVEEADAMPRDELRARIVQVGPGSTIPTVAGALVFQVEAIDSRQGNNDGAGIREVNLEIFSPDGAKVYGRTERNAAYCAFAGGEPDCNVFEFTIDQSQWPDGGYTVRAGPHRLLATVFAEDGRTTTVETTIQIE
jgi:hypothetical protein